LHGVTFEWKDGADLEGVENKVQNGNRKVCSLFNFPKGTQYGVIAQEVEMVLPELVVTDANGFKSVDYVKITPILIEAVKEQQQQIDSLKKLNTELLANFNLLKDELEIIRDLLKK